MIENEEIKETQIIVDFHLLISYNTIPIKQSSLFK